MRRLITFCAATVLILAAGNAHADMIIDFESLALNTTVTNQFSGIGANFNGHATIIGSSSLFPSYSGDKVIFNSSGYEIKVDAVGPEPEWLMAGGYVTGAENVTLRAYDSSDTELVSASTGGVNTVGHGTPNKLLRVYAPNIDYVIFRPDSTSSTFTVDNFTFNPVPVPAAVLLGVLGLSVAGMKLRRFV